ncbi:hypothetical protein JAAARDRAFT_203500 [Jaapia argillacea MUCL 33604]|uniref:Acyl-CoA dehydrogenase/oxidase C-terminal domain-containing protein n=1 Tax=Jaapia argillacea MUCL 33604 TaxID=933084 RepID=A0A067Q5L0_9AGAM|nr:hypothetical protein JAAARDRAFT_203500 [Jaapia argillacea MUCL 33604]
MRVEDGFQQTPTVEGNPYTADPVLRGLLRRTLPTSVLQEVEPDLERFANELIITVQLYSSQCTKPTVIQYDHYGRRIDNLQTSEGWRKLRDFSQREGIIGIFYERKFGEHSRSYGFAKMLLATGDTQVIFCPLSMTDGCARVIELHGTPAMKKEVYPRLISRDPSQAFTSGQWMTERTGGSDVSQTETIADPSSHTSNATPLGPTYTLNGFKWFSSATDSDVALALGRTGPTSAGSRSLSLFLVPLRLPFPSKPSDPTPHPTSNGILIHRLKDKIGTQILPTAELSLEDSEGYLIGPLNKGVKTITPVLNITRIHSSISSIGYLRKCLALARSYSTSRTINNDKVLLQDSPLHVAQLAKVALVYRALTHLTFGAIRLLGRTECGCASDDEERRLRMMTPTTKAFCAEMAVTAMEECMASMGGQGYMEETGIGRCIRDGLAEKIWEGTVTVLSLDLVRAAQDPTNMKAFTDWTNSIITSCPASLHGTLEKPLNLLKAALADVSTVYSHPIPPLLPRPALLLVAQIATSIYLLEHALWSFNNSEIERDVDLEVFVRWVLEGGLREIIGEVNKTKTVGEEKMAMDNRIVYGSAGAPMKPKL